jgi:hypothetical protein
MLNPKCVKLNIKKAIPRVLESEAFRVFDGKKIHSIQDLITALERMEHSVFRIHVNSKKNDFAQWIRFVLNDKKLARLLRWTTTKETTIQKIRSYIEEHYL